MIDLGNYTPNKAPTKDDKIKSLEDQVKELQEQLAQKDK